MRLEFLVPEAFALLALVPVAWWLGARSGRPGGWRSSWSRLLRAIILILLAVGLARPRIVQPVDVNSVAYLLDDSHSVPGPERDRALAFLEQGIDGAETEDMSAVVVFGAAPAVDRSARPGGFEPVLSVTEGQATDIGAALRIGMALLPSGTGRRMVLLSDGHDNMGRFDREIDLLAAAGVEVDIVPLEAALAGDEVAVARLEAPASSRIGQRVTARAIVRANVASRARVMILDGADVLLDQEADLAPGESEFEAVIEPDSPGFRHFSVQVFPERDTRVENNSASAFTIVSGPPKVLVVAREEDEAAPLVSALEGAGRHPELVEPSGIPDTLLGLSEFDTVILVNVPARTVDPETLNLLPGFVRELGHGLIMIGGDRSFGAGGYRDTVVEKALPVDMEVRDRESRPDTSLVFVVDKSGSMAECQMCGTGTGSYSNLNKVALAKEAVAQAAEVLRPEDQVGLVAFDDRSHLLWPLAPHDQADAFEQVIGGITADGGTNILSGMEGAVRELEAAETAVRHIILLTDGWSDASGYDDVLARMDNEGITMSVVAVGQDAAPYLAELAESAGGRYYPVVDPADIPQIFVDETITTLGMYIVEERFQPVPGVTSEILAGLDPGGVPPLGGYNGTTAKQSARVALWSHREDPVLAQWQYGLGRSVAWTSDVKKQWSVDWIDWGEFTSFAVQLVDWTVPRPDDEGLAAEVAVEGGRARIKLAGEGDAARSMAGLEVEARIAGPDDVGIAAALPQTGAATYEGEVPLPGEGTYAVRIIARQDGRVVGSQTAGIVVPYSPEYADPSAQPTDPRIYRLAEVTNGMVLDDPALAYREVPGVRRADEVWMWPFALAVLLFPLDVAVRRLKVGREELGLAAGWLGSRVPGRRTKGVRGAAGVRGGLSAARERTEWRADRRAGVESADSTRRHKRRAAATDQADDFDGMLDAPDGQPGDYVGEPMDSAPADEVEPVSETLARLRAAKRRADRRR